MRPTSPFCWDMRGCRRVPHPRLYSLTKSPCRDSVPWEMRRVFAEEERLSMVALSALWLPIILSAVIVFFASFLMHMLLKYHQGDYKQLPSEEKVAAAIRDAAAAPGLYMFPYTTHADMKSPATAEKLT